MGLNVENIYINVDEIQNVLTCLGNLTLLKKIQTNINDGDFSYIENLYRNYPLFRDYDFESYNGVAESEVGILFLDAIFKDKYTIDEFFIDDTTQYELDKLAYDFRIPENFRLNKKEYEDGFESYSILSLSSDNIKKTLTIAENDKDILAKLLEKTNRLSNLCFSELYEGSTIDLENKEINVLYGTCSIYYIEEDAECLYDLELFCKEVVLKYGL